jgi:TolB protein
MKPDGSEQRQVVTRGECHAASLGADGRIYFQASKLTVPMDELYRVNIDGSRLELLTDTPDFHEGDPRPSPDGKWLAFSRKAKGSTGGNNIWVMDLASGAETQLTNSFGTCRSPVWSPDGSQIAFMSDVDGDAELYVMNADGTGVVQITHNTITDWTNDWADVRMGH